LIRQSASSIPDTSLEKRQESSSGDSNVHLDTHARKKNTLYYKINYTRSLLSSDLVKFLEKTPMAIKNGQTREPQATLGIRQITKTKKTKSITQKAKKVSNTDPMIKPVVTQMFARGQQFLYLVRHPPCLKKLYDRHQELVDPYGMSESLK